ncbi:hypothetical protein P4O66_004651 [Electrophorus voltai]|uniref:Uncharacterized protein n=1 Tax=Electrophorus voltai TaxID=2609070 RepID=A0AAD8ZK96_9TELE|nr:hypothetical protein P4O66_004651 [Electrophorus voltai]
MGNITVWFGNSTKQDRQALQRVVRSAERITHMELPDLQSIYYKQCQTKARRIVKDPTHPNNRLFSLLSCRLDGWLDFFLCKAEHSGYEDLKECVHPCRWDFNSRTERCLPLVSVAPDRAPIVLELQYTSACSWRLGAVAETGGETGGETRGETRGKRGGQTEGETSGEPYMVGETAGDWCTEWWETGGETEGETKGETERETERETESQEDRIRWGGLRGASQPALPRD